MQNKENKILIICYNSKKYWNSREQALSFYQRAAFASDGSEQERYLKIVEDLSLGKTFIYDEYEEVDNFEDLVKETDKIEKVMRESFKKSNDLIDCIYFGDIGKCIVSVGKYNEYVSATVKFKNGKFIYYISANLLSTKGLTEHNFKTNNGTKYLEKEYSTLQDIIKDIKKIKII